MRGKYFRYLFENLDGGLFHTGSIYDKERQKSTNYVYMAGSYCRNAPQNTAAVSGRKDDRIPEIIDFLVMSSYNAEYINRLIGIVKNHEVKTVILPYLAPIQRLVLVEEIKDGSITGKEAAHFLQDPYRFLKKCGIGNVYFLSGNGDPIRRKPEELEKKFCFEQADTELLKIIWEMEGYAIPVVQAGYFIENGFLFYFGVYGLDIHVLSDFTKEYFSHIENIDKISENMNEDYTSQMKRLIQEYLRKFGNSPVTTITMFAGPLHASVNENNSFMTEQEFNRKEDGEKWAGCKKDRTCACVVSCAHKRDHDVMQRYKRSLQEPRFGVLMLGNANLNRYLSEILTRFSKIMPRIRGISVPNCGNGEDWNHQILEFLGTKDRIYWICSKHDMTSPGVVSDIVLSVPNSRFLAAGRNWGYCLSGYIIPKEDID